MTDVREIRNLTPHPVSIMSGWMLLTILPLDAEHPARLDEEVKMVDSIESTMNGASFPIPVVRKAFGNGKNIPVPERGVAFIVSAVVAAGMPERRDFLVPAEFERDENGNIVACRALATMATEGFSVEADYLTESYEEYDRQAQQAYDEYAESFRGR